jgi:curved DNA-binding protein CbpA
MSGPEEFIFGWLNVVDELTYYELFGIGGDATTDDIRGAFHAFCDTFHPDRHFARPQDERQALSAIFKRGTEGYLVLSDEALRGHYDAQLAVVSPGHPPRITFSALSRPPARRVSEPAPLEDAVRAPSARPFARRADELIQRGDLRQAKLQLVMANHKDPGNAALESALREIDERLLGR